MIAFKDMPSHSRIWIYQCDRELTSSETDSIKRKAEEFVSQWTSHDQLMKTCIEILHNLFLVVCVDEKTAPASGCGIDKSVHFIEQLEKDFKISLKDRMNVAYRVNGKILLSKLSELKTSLPNGQAESGVSVFNNLVQTKEELEKSWEVPVEKSWHKQFID